MRPVRLKLVFFLYVLLPEAMPRPSGSPNSGQAHDMFSRIFRIRMYDFFLPNIKYVRFVFIFLNTQKLGNIGEKILGFIFGKFVKTCRELNNRLQQKCGRLFDAVWLPA